MRKFTQERKEAFDETVGNRYHLYEQTNHRIKYYALGPMQRIPFHTYTFVLHDDCTRKVYKQLKKNQQEVNHVHQVVHPRRIVGLGSRARRRGKEFGATPASFLAYLDRKGLPRPPQYDRRRERYLQDGVWPKESQLDN